ncbi:hypothetical protein SCA6_000719, partial [Theobroma cacao]
MSRIYPSLSSLVFNWLHAFERELMAVWVGKQSSILMFQECYKTEYDFSQYPENDFVTKLHHGRDNELLIETI